MFVTTPTCPTCGRPAIGTADLIPGEALFGGDPTKGEVEWSGETDVFWDGQFTDRKDGLPLVTCADGHEWPSQIHEPKQGATDGPLLPDQ